MYQQAHNGIIIRKKGEKVKDRKYTKITAKTSQFLNNINLHLEAQQTP